MLVYVLVMVTSFELEQMFFFRPYRPYEMHNINVLVPRKSKKQSLAPFHLKNSAELWCIKRLADEVVFFIIFTAINFWSHNLHYLIHVAY